MALDTFANLKVSIRDWSHRNDLPDSLIEDFILMAEAEMYDNEEEPLAIRNEETRAQASTSITSRYLALPDDFIEMRSFYIIPSSGNNIDIKFRAPENLRTYDTTGVPTRFTITSQIELSRASDQVYTVEMNYLKVITALSDSNTTNAILTNHPSIYMWGSRWALSIWTKQLEASVLFRSMFISAIRGANNQDQKGRYGPAPIMRIEGVTP